MNKKLLVTVLIFVAVLVVAGLLYARLGETMTVGGLATTATEAPATTEASTAATEASVATEASTAATEAPQTQPTETTEPVVVPAVDFTVVDADGNPVSLSDYFGKPIVLNFWTYWCDACQSEMYQFNAMYEELGGEVTFLMVHSDANMEGGKALVAENGYTFPVLYDNDHVAAATYGIHAYPTSFFIDAEGNLQAYYIGAMRTELLQIGVDMIYTP